MQVQHGTAGVEVFLFWPMPRGIGVSLVVRQTDFGYAIPVGFAGEHFVFVVGDFFESQRETSLFGECRSAFDFSFGRASGATRWLVPKAVKARWN